MDKLQISTYQKKEVADITGDINRYLKEKGMAEGLCHLFLLHTTAALTTADLDPGTDLDMLDAFEIMLPKHANNIPSPADFSNTKAPIRIKYRHPHDPSHVPDHILSSLIGTSLTLPFKNDRVLLGTWQRVVLVEFDGPRNREIVISVISADKAQ